MARTQATTYAGLSLDTSNTGSPIWETPLDALAENQNRLWGQWSPSIVSTRTPGSATQYHEVASGTADKPVYALRFPVTGARTALTTHPRLLCENALGGDGKTLAWGVESVGASSTTWHDLSLTTSYAWQNTETTIAPISGSSSDIVGLHLRTDDNSPGYVRIRGLECHLSEYSGELASGIDGSGVIPADTDQWDGDSPLSVGNAADLDTSHAAMHEGWLWPVCAVLDNITSPIPIVWSSQSSYEQVFGPIYIPKRVGENVSSVSYSTILDRSGGSSSDCQIRVSTRLGPSLNAGLIDSNEHTAFGTMTSSAWKTPGNWADDSLSTGTGSCYLFIEAKSDGAVNTRVYSFIAWATGR